MVGGKITRKAQGMRKYDKRNCKKDTIEGRKKPVKRTNQNKGQIQSNDLMKLFNLV